MPTYTYKCKTCEYQFDYRQSMADDPLTDCPNCGEPQLRKVINSAGIVFKGSGFYVTDNRNGSTSKTLDSTAKSKSGATDGATKSESSPDSKPAVKSSEKAAAAE